MSHTPRSPLHQDPPSGSAPPHPLVIAHRGASHDLPEHTMAAYRRAIEDGADGLECDVRLSRDGHLVCVHDADVRRTSSGRGSVSAMSLAELRALDWGSWHQGPSASGQDIRALLTLRELFEVAASTPRPLGLSVETKHPSRFGPAVERALVELLQEYGWAGADSPVRMMSFSLLAVRRIRRLAPQLPTVLLIERLLPTLADGRLPAGIGTVGISVALLRRDPDYVRRAHTAGHAVHVWTVDEPDDVQRCLAADVDGIITNRPREVLAQRGTGR